LVVEIAEGNHLLQPRDVGIISTTVTAEHELCNIASGTVLGIHNQKLGDVVCMVQLKWALVVTAELELFGMASGTVTNSLYSGTER